MGIARADRLGVRQVELAEELHGGGLRLGAPHHAVADRRLADLVHQRHRRIERRRGALRDVGELQAAQAPPLVQGHRAQVGAGEQDLPADDEAVAAGVAHRGEADRRLAGARFADQADHLAPPELERDVVDQHRAVAAVGPHRDPHRAGRRARSARRVTRRSCAFSLPARVDRQHPVDDEIDADRQHRDRRGRDRSGRRSRS